MKLTILTSESVTIGMILKSKEGMILAGITGVVFLSLVAVIILLIVKSNKKEPQDNSEILTSIASLQSSLQSSQQQASALQNQHDETLLMKQQENLTSIQALSDNLFQTYQNMLEGFRTLNENNATSSQIISDMSTHINNMSNIMVNKKSRGNWGEY